LLESGWVFQLDRDVVALLSEMAGGFQDGVHANDNRVRDCGDAGKEVAPSWLTVPEKMMLDCLASATWLVCVSANVAIDGASIAVQRMPTKKLDEFFMCASSCSAQS